MTVIHRLLLLAALTPVSACSSSPPNPPFKLELRAAAADGLPLAGVAFSLEGKPVGVTGADGRLVRELAGMEGASVRVAVICPADYQPPTQPAPLRLTRTRSIEASAPQALPVDVRCERRQIDIVLVVKAEHGERLPVLLNGKPVATTDDDGIAHVLLRHERAQKSLEVAVDTTTRAALKPVSPSRTYELSGRDAVVLFEPTFVVAAPLPPRRSAPRRHVPVRVD